MSIYKACDIRGRFGVDLRVEHAARLGAAVRAIKGVGTVLVGGDARLSTPKLKTALVESLLQAGCDVVDLGNVPTPLFYFARRTLGIETGVMVTASHNPAPDNGFKITLGPLPVTPEEMRALAQHMEAAEPPTFPGPRGKLTPLNLLPDYVGFLCAQIPDLTGLKVVIDCANGMAGLAARPLWASSGAEVSLLLEAPDGRFPAHPPNPAEAKNLAFLCEQVRQQGADLGIAYDGDGDRVAFVDEQGRAVSGDQAIVLFAAQSLRGGPETIIYDQKCSRIVPDTVQALGGTAVREVSGHTYIKRAFLTHNAVYAGELSGHHFFRAVMGDDALYASCVFAHLLKEKGWELSQLVDEIPAYPITPEIRVPMSVEDIQRLMEGLAAALSGEAAVDRIDGIRIEFPDGWGLVRPSVTEPVVTLRFEGLHPAALLRIARRVEEVSPLLSGKILPLIQSFSSKGEV